MQPVLKELMSVKGLILLIALVALVLSIIAVVEGGCGSSFGDYKQKCASKGDKCDKIKCCGSLFCSREGETKHICINPCNPNPPWGDDCSTCCKTDAGLCCPCGMSKDCTNFVDNCEKCKKK